MTVIPFGRRRTNPHGTQLSISIKRIACRACKHSWLAQGYNAMEGFAINVVCDSTCSQCGADENFDLVGSDYPIGGR